MSALKFFIIARPPDIHATPLAHKVFGSDRPPYLLLQPSDPARAENNIRFQAPYFQSSSVACDGWEDGWMRHARLPHPSPSPFNFKPLISPSSHFLVSLPAQPPRTAWLEGLTADTLGNKYRLRATTFSCHPSIHQGFLYILGNTLMLVRQLLIVMSYIKIILN